VIEKGKSIGSHSLSGAMMNPQPLRELFPDLTDDQLPTYGAVNKESVYFMTSRKRAIKLPTPPEFQNHGNHAISLSGLNKFLAEQAEALGAYVLPETDAQTLLVENGAVRGIRTGVKGLDKEGNEKAGAAPATEVHAQVTVLAEGAQGKLREAAMTAFNVSSPFPQVYALGVKELWKVPKGLDRIIHTLGWPLRGAARYREFGGSWLYPMGPEHISMGMVVGLDWADSTLSVHDLLQEFKLHPLIKKILEGGYVDIIQPDPSHAGGITETRKIAHMAEAYDVALALHCPLGPIALAVNLQLDAGCYNAFIQEQSLGIHYNQGNDLLDYIKNPEVFDYADGYVKIPDGPGLGIEVNEDYVIEQAAVGHRWRNPVWRHADGSFAEW